MNKYNFYISYNRRDGIEIALQVSRQLTAKGYSVFMDAETLQAGNFVESIAAAIANSDCFIPIITKGYEDSMWAKKELSFALSESRGRAKKVFPVVMSDELSPEIGYYISGIQALELDFNSGTGEAAKIIADKVDFLFSGTLKGELLYEKLSEYRKLKDRNKIAGTLCELIDLKMLSRDNLPEKMWCRDMLSLYESLSEYSGDYDDASVSTAREILKRLNTVEKIWTEPEATHSGSIFVTDIFYISFVLRMIYFDRIIRSECADITTQGNAVSACPVSWYVKKQALYAEAYEKCLRENDYTDKSTEPDIIFIKETENYIFGSAEDFSAGNRCEKKKTEESTLTEDDEILVSIAEFMREGNKLFDILQKNGIAGDFLKCLLTSYERLKNYCEIVGANVVAAECVDRIVEIRNELDRQQNSDAPENEKIEKGIKSLLGFTLKNTGNYDVFISFKNEDSDLAEKIYRYCHKHMKEPFWSKKTLPELSKSEYEDAIYTALRNSKHFIVVLSKLDYLNANWIKTEMSTFHRAITEGRKKDANFVFVVTDEIYRAIIDSNKMCLDERYCGYQIIKMSEYEDTLAQYIS